MTYIKLSNRFRNKFNHHKQTILIETLFEALLYKLRTGISYRNIEETKFNVSYQSLYKFHVKIMKLKFLETFYDEYMLKYINNIGNKFKEFYMDSTLIANKYGSDKITYNKQLLKHKSSKISIIEFMEKIIMTLNRPLLF